MMAENLWYVHVVEGGVTPTWTGLALMHEAKATGSKDWVDGETGPA